MALNGCLIAADRETADSMDADSPCATAETCEDACDGARWGCAAVVDLRRSTCDKTEAACTFHCKTAEAQTEPGP